MNKSNWIILLISILNIPVLQAQHWDSIHTGLNLNYDSPPNIIYADSNYFYMAGSFHIVDGQHIQGIARWNGVKWDSMGAGIDRLIMYDTGRYNPEQAFAMTTYHHKLYVGGEFFSVGYLNAPGIGVWNGTAWDTVMVQPFRNYSIMATNQDVFALTIINNKLYMGGDFDTVAGKPCIGVAYWNDTNWNSLNFPKLSLFSQINSICEYQGSIYVGGLFDGSINGTADNICRWDSAGWHTVGSAGIPGSLSDVMCMAVYNGALYVGGEFSTTDGNAGNNIEKWDGTKWSDVSGGVDFQVYNLFVYNGKLYVMGKIKVAGGIPVHGIAEWDGTKWCSFSGYIDNNIISSACLYHDSLCIGGNFAITGSDTITDIAEWVGGDYTDSCSQPTAVNEVKVESENVKVYPNPCNGNFTLSLSNVNESCILRIYNELGQQVYQSSINSANTEVNLNNQPEGVYLYRVLNESGGLIGEGKMVIQ